MTPFCCNKKTEVRQDCKLHFMQYADFVKKGGNHSTVHISRSIILWFYGILSLIVWHLHVVGNVKSCKYSNFTSFWKARSDLILCFLAPHHVISCPTWQKMNEEFDHLAGTPSNNVNNENRKCERLQGVRMHMFFLYSPRWRQFALVGVSGLSVSPHVSVTARIRSGTKGCSLIEMVRHQNKEMNKAHIMTTCKGLVFLNNMPKLFFHHDRSNTLLTHRFWSHTLTPPTSKMTNWEANK